MHISIYLLESVGIIRDGVMKMVDKVNRREFSGNGIVLGGTLVSKHIAQASLCCVTEEQSIDIGEASLINHF